MTDTPTPDNRTSETSAFDAVVAVGDLPVYVVTTVSPTGRSGCLVGFATQTSIDPRRFLVGISRSNHTHGIALSAEYLAVHLIPRGHAEMIELFGGETGDEVDKFARCRWFDGPHGLPILSDSGIWFAGRILERLDVGDHLGYLLEPVGGGIRVADPDRGEWVRLADTRSIEPGHSA
ncbi:flavin reductase family protein [Gordonia zhaorongruii]|uniref:flavin reductase family protein n=1 Tax=Gordonia zhaorongruii TaxID=2597659 RepID=UPI001F3846E1|nr:flavin reductase family protein [Gordonia zhaorongruii]